MGVLRLVAILAGQALQDAPVTETVDAKATAAQTTFPFAVSWL